MTSSEVAWWTPLWKRLVLMAVFVAAVGAAALAGGVITVAVLSFIAGSSAYQLFGNFPPKVIER
jgi:hypothetical protein